MTIGNELTTTGLRGTLGARGPRDDGTKSREDVLAERDVLLEQTLKESAAARAAMKRKFGFIPLSVLKLSRGVLSNQMFNYQREQPKHKSTAQGTAREKEARLRQFGVKHSASQKISGRGSDGLSMMPAELVDFFCNYYCEPGDTYGDMFMGQGIRMQIAHRRKLVYYGYDLSKPFFDYTSSVADKIDPDHALLHINHGDSRMPINVPDESCDFCFTSPPYWDIEYYSDDAEQLGAPGVTYDEFLRGMYEVMRAWHPKFKDDAVIVLNVNDFRKNGLFYAYHADLIPVMRKAGYYLTDVWIIEGLVGGMPKAFAASFNDQHIAPKVHEYALTFRKRAVQMPIEFDE